jgi:hypothetical protein
MTDYIDQKIEAMFGANEKRTNERFKHYETRFFEKAHEHFYGCTPDVRIQVAQYHRGVVSDVMCRYVTYLRSK